MKRIKRYQNIFRGVRIPWVMLAVLLILNIIESHVFLEQTTLTADIIDTYVYRMGLQEGKFELATAVGLFKSVINFTLVVIANKVARMAGEEGIY